MSIAQRLYHVAPDPIKRLGFNAYARYLRWLREGPGLEKKISLLEHLDRASREEVAIYQLSRINELMSWSKANVPYYRDVLGNIPCNTGGLENLSDLRAPARETGHAEPDEGILPQLREGVVDP